MELHKIIQLALQKLNIYKLNQFEAYVNLQDLVDYYLAVKKNTKWWKCLKFLSMNLNRFFSINFMIRTFIFKKGNKNSIFKELMLF